jgi:hypothetical protein
MGNYCVLEIIHANDLNSQPSMLSSILTGAARVKDCLEEHRNEDGFSDECKAQVSTAPLETFEQHPSRSYVPCYTDGRLRSLTCPPHMHHTTPYVTVCVTIHHVKTIDTDLIP